MAEPETEPNAAVGSGADEDSLGMPPESQGDAGRADDKAFADAVQLLTAMLEALPPERPQVAATAGRLEGGRPPWPWNCRASPPRRGD